MDRTGQFVGDGVGLGVAGAVVVDGGFDDADPPAGRDRAGSAAGGAAAGTAAAGRDGKGAPCGVFGPDGRSAGDGDRDGVPAPFPGTPGAVLTAAGGAGGPAISPRPVSALTATYAPIRVIAPPTMPAATVGCLRTVQ